MTPIPINKIQVGRKYKTDLKDDKGAILIPANTPITSDLIAWIKGRGVESVYTDDLALAAAAVIKEANKRIDGVEGGFDPTILESLDFDEIYKEMRSIKFPRLRPRGQWAEDGLRTKMLDGRLKFYPGWDKPKGSSLANEILETPDNRTHEYKQDFLVAYHSALKDIKTILDKIAEGTLARADSIILLVNRIVEQFLRDKNLMLNFSLIKSNHEETILHHSLNVCIISINIASSIGYNRKQVQEIGIGALLHDIGMMLVDPEIRYKRSGLAPSEMSKIHRHPIEGLFLISKVKGLPESTEYILYQHHEREDGTGYPKSRKSNAVHRYARIVGLADVFDAMTSKRPYRPAHNPYDAVLELLRLVKQGKISSEIMRYFIKFTSLFPVGSYVRLNDGRIARIIEPNGRHYTRPIISIVNEGDMGNTDTKKIDLSKSKHLKIIEAIPMDTGPGQDILKGF